MHEEAKRKGEGEALGRAPARHPRCGVGSHWNSSGGPAQGSQLLRADFSFPRMTAAPDHLPASVPNLSYEKTYRHMHAQSAQACAKVCAR